MAIEMTYMGEKEEFEVRWNKAKHDLLNVLQGIELHNDLALEAAKTCGDLRTMEISPCLGNLDASWKEAEAMVKLANKYIELIGEMRKLAFMYFQRYYVQTQR